MPSPPHRHPAGAARNGLSTISQSQIQQECSPTAGLSMASSTATSPRTLSSSSSRQRNKRRRREHPEPRAADTPQSPSPICVLPSASSCYNPSKSTTTTTTTTTTTNFASSMMMRTNDEIHSDIPLCPVMMAIIDTPYFQRLKGLKQLGTSDSTYMNANHTRFEHSLGVAHISKLMIERISHHQPRLGITAKDMLCVQLAGLLHDIGHGPYSHVYDSQFPRRLAQMMESTHPEWKHHYEKSLPTKPKDWCHEDASVMLIDAVLAFFGLTIDEQDLDVPLKSMVVLLAPGVVPRRKSPDFFRVHDVASSSAEDYDPDDDGVAAAAAGNGANSVTPSNLFARTDCSQESSSSSTTTSAGVVLTSRDWIFIKEMIRHEPHIPLSKEERLADDQSGFIGRPLRSQEFLYDIVANRHHGLDTDKIDYFARDERRTQKGNGEIERRLIEEAVVAWGDCPKPHDCFRCRRLLLASPSNPTTTTSTADTTRTRTTKTTMTMTMTDDTNADTNSTFMKMNTTHLMVVWPLKCAEMICGFFHKRFRNHSQVYTHKTTQASTYMICDILTLADPFYRIRPAGLPANLLAAAFTTCTATTGTTGTTGTATTNTGTGTGTNSTAVTTTGLPISRAMLNPHTYRVLKDSIIDVLEATSDSNLEPCRRLIERWRCRDFYKCCVTQKLHPNKKGNYDNDHHNNNNNDDSKYWLDQWIWNERTELEIAQELITLGGYHDGMVDSEQRSPMALLTQEEIIEGASIEYSDDDDDDDNDDDDDDDDNDNAGEKKKKKNRKMTLEWDDIIVEKLAIHSGAGAGNPVSNVRFVSRNDVGRIGGRSIDALPMAVAVQEADYEAHLPRSFIEYSLRIYCTHSEKRDLVRHVFETWWLGLREGLKEGGGGGGGPSSGPTATTYEYMTTTTDTAAMTATTSPPKEEE